LAPLKTLANCLVHKFVLLALLLVFPVGIASDAIAQEPTSNKRQAPTPTPTPAGKSYSAGGAIKPPAATRPQVQSPVTFTEIRSQLKIGFKREPSFTSIKYLLEAMGGGVAMFDYDNDGRIDLFFTNGAHLKDPMPRGEMPDKSDSKYWNRLYHQKADGTFADVTESAGVRGDWYGMGAAAADYDNDGYTDLFVTGYGGNQLYRNNGDGTFTDVTKNAGVAGGGWSSSAGWLDYDSDGRLDLFVGRYMEWDFDTGSLYCGETRPGYRAFCHPDNFRGVTNILYRQRADGSFEDVSTRAGVANSGGKALGVAFGDFDNDGLTDIFVANDSVRQSLYHNKGDGTFEDIAVISGSGYDENGKTYAGMGIDVGDYDNDGFMDVFITTLSTETYPLYHNDHDLTFTYATNSAGVGQITLLYSGWGTRFVDVDNDGWRDLFVAQGHVLDTIEKSNPYLKYRQPPLLMMNTGKGYANASASAGSAFAAPVNGRGAAFGDLNNDGQVDVVVATLDSAPLVLRNNGSKNRWLGISLLGSKSNRNGIGARISVIDDTGRRQILDAHTCSSYLSSNDPRVLIGLGKATKVNKLEVKWPSGMVQTVTEPALDRYMVLREPAANNSKQDD